MTTAEKRAALEADGVPWPDCECHGTPMLWQRNVTLSAGGRFHCRVARSKTVQARRVRHVEAGLCAHCTEPAVTETLCRAHADAHADVMSQPKQKLDHQFAVMRQRARRRAAEGFQPTGVGLAVFAAWTKGGS